MSEEIIPKPYSNTDTAEIEAINTLKNYLDLKYVKPDIKERDKIPNVDGYLEIVDEKQVPLGKLEVQVRKIPNGSTSYSCNIELFAYSERTSLPVLLICVDVDNKKAYWKHIQRSMAIGKENQKTITVIFSIAEEEINESLLYLSRWTLIAADYADRIKNFGIIKNQLEEVSKYISPIKDLNKESVAALQAFVDELNRLLDSEYGVVKRIFFKDIWKIGIAVHSFTNERISYSLFSIKTGHTDSLIKSVDLSTAEIFKNGPYGFMSFWGCNEIKENPRKEARKLVYSRLEEILRNKMLSIANEFLCTEYIFDFIDKHLVSLGLEKKDIYTIEELQFALQVYLPRWCLTALKYVKYPKHLDHVDPGLLKMLLGTATSKEVHEKTVEIIQGKIPVSPFFIGSLFFSFKIVYEALSYFTENKYSRINRIYRRRNSKDLENRTSGFIWEGYNQADLDYNATILLNNFEKVLNDFIKINSFDPVQYNLFNKYDKVIFVPELKERYQGKEFPGLRTYYLKLTEGSPEVSKTECLNAGNFDIKVSPGDIVQFKNKKYKVEICSARIADFFFQRTPMLFLVYEVLEDRAKNILHDN